MHGVRLGDPGGTVPRLEGEALAMRILIDTHANLYPLSRLPSAVVDREDLETQGE